MSSEHIWMSQVNFPAVIAKYKPKWGKRFQWQWCVEYEYGNGQKATVTNIETRTKARSIKRTLLRTPGTTRNPVIKRRLVQVDWEDYADQPFSTPEKRKQRIPR